jgi:hypothetical protein
MRVTPALDDAPEVAAALAERWQATAPLGAGGRPLVLLGHGPQSDEDLLRWQEAFKSYASALRQSGYTGDIRPQFLRDDAEPPVRAEAIRLLRDTVTTMAARTGDSVTVMTVLIATGPMTSARIPQDIAGLPVRYLPIGVTPHPAVARWIERSAAGTMAQATLP